jgi:hypothetical protein
MTGAVMAGLLTSGASAVDRPVFHKMDQPVAWLSYDDGKYLSVMTHYRGLERVTSVLCGTNVGGVPRPAKSGFELQWLQPLCSWTKYSEGNIQLEKFYRGWRESYVARATERLLRMVGFAPNATYKGTLLVDEYNQGLPQKWTLPSGDVPFIVAYMRNQFSQANIAPSATKPVLLLELIDANGTVSDDDSAFLNTYYDMAAIDDQDVHAFFTKADERKNDCFAATANAHTVGASVGEYIMAKTVDQLEKLELGKVGGLIVGLIASKLVYDYCKDPLTSLFTDVVRDANGHPVCADGTPVQLDHHKPQTCFSTISKVAAGGVVALVLSAVVWEFVEEAKANAAAEAACIACQAGDDSYQDGYDAPAVAPATAPAAA